MDLPSLLSFKEKFLGHSGSQTILILRIVSFILINFYLTALRSYVADTWDNLQSVWCKRFLEEIAHLETNVKEKYFSRQIKREFKDIEYFRMFWTSIILHRKNEIREMENEITKEQSNENTRSFIEQFESSYKGLDDEKKWILGSGNKVEDIIYKYGSKLKYENLVHSFVLDTDDKKIRDLFSANEWNEILEKNSKKSPKIEPDLLCYITQYRKAHECKRSSKNELVRIGYDRLTLYEIKPRVFEKSHLERWYDTNIWSSIIDQCMWNLKDVELIRGESCSIASSERKAKNRIMQERKPFGRRGDGVFRMEKGLCEYGAAEHGHLFKGEKDKKFMSDGFKLTRMLRDMLGRFSAELSTEVFKQIEMVGYLHSERMLQIFALDYAEGYMIRLRKGALLEVPKEPVEIDNLLKLMTAVLSSKLRIARTISLLKTPEQSNDLEFAGELSTAGKIERFCSNNRILDLPDPPSSPPSSSSSKKHSSDTKMTKKSKKRKP
ncbi:523_t:CDS:10 [Rhizophagus irregularis]|nr:523_t:CDS:10 [Rhizophagus irregularis]